MADRLWSAIRTSLGKVADARVLLIGTRPSTESHFFAKLLSGKSPATYAVSYHADPDDDPFRPGLGPKPTPR